MLYTNDADEKLHMYYEKYKRPVIFQDLEEDFSFANCTIFYENNSINNEDMDDIYKLVEDMKMPISKRDNGKLDIDFQEKK